MVCQLAITALLFCSCVLCDAASRIRPGKKLFNDDYETVKFSPNQSPGFAYYTVNGSVPSTGRPYTVHVAYLATGLPASFSIQLPTDGCCHVSHTSDTAKAHNCLYATNGGFFNEDTGCCIGNLIVDGNVVEFSGDSRVSFGLTPDSFVVGYMTNTTLKGGSLKLAQLIEGAGWIVRGGQSYINTSMVTEQIPAQFVTLKAPRTAVAVSATGAVGLIQVDGVEDLKVGLDLYEFSEVIIALGWWHAANLDGGGSSVSVYKGTVVSQPTCEDVPLICERAVTSITCMQP
ncbi:hypothetical protein EMCRGX_G034797 [Ephydatia muelleri]